MQMPSSVRNVAPVGSYVGSFPRQYLYDEYGGSIRDHVVGVGVDPTSGALLRTGAGAGGGMDSHDVDVVDVRDGESYSGAEKPRILLMGLKRSGKTSIQKVVFHKMSPNETLFLESTNNIVKDDLSDMSFIRFKIWDVPGHVELFEGMFDFEALFMNTSAIIFVIDAQEDCAEAIAKLHQIISRSYKVQPQLRYEVFIHKVDCLSDEQKIDTSREITQKVNDDLLDAGLESVCIGFHLTTIYDHSIFESFSKVVQKLLAHMAAFENLLNIFIQNSLLEKAFLFDVASKIYLATDCNIVDMQIYELCCDMIDVVVDIASIYNPRSEMDSFFSERTSSTIRLNNDTVLYLRGVNKHLAMVCILREEALEKLGIIEYNFQCIKRGLLQILELKPCTPSLNGPGVPAVQTFPRSPYDSNDMHGAPTGSQAI